MKRGRDGAGGGAYCRPGHDIAQALEAAEVQRALGNLGRETNEALDTAAGAGSREAVRRLAATEQ